MHITQQFTSQGMISAGHPTATYEGLKILEEGGNAFDALITVASLMNVFLPMSCGLGGDHALVGFCAKRQQVFQQLCLGAAPSKATIKNYLALGYKNIPEANLVAATIPATLEAYITLYQRHAQLPLKRLLKPAIDYAENGFKVNRQAHRWIESGASRIRANDSFRKIYLDSRQRAKSVGEVLVQSGLAQTFKKLACSINKPEKLTHNIARHLLKACSEHQHFFEYKDFLIDQCEFSNPISLRFGDYTIYTSSLPTQGYVFLQNLFLLKQCLKEQKKLASSKYIHLLSEIFNQTYYQRLHKAGDPKFVQGHKHLLTKGNLAELYKRINYSQKSNPLCKNFYSDGDTTYFSVVDKDGNAASCIQSLSLGFGCGVFDEITGVIFNQRLARSATLMTAHPSCVLPHKRPINTILPFMIFKNGRLFAIGGTPGGDGQVQWNAAFLGNYLFRNTPIYESIAEPRWTYFPGSDRHDRNKQACIEVDESFPYSVRDELIELGYKVEYRTKVLGCIRYTEKLLNGWLGMDDGREDGLTLRC